MTLQGIMNKLRAGQFATYKIVTRTPGKFGCSVRIRHSLNEAKDVASKAKSRGKTAEIYVLRQGEWELI